MRQLSEPVVDIVLLIAAHLIDISLVLHLDLFNLGLNAVLVVSLNLLHLFLKLPFDSLLQLFECFTSCWLVIFRENAFVIIIMIIPAQTVLVFLVHVFI